MYASNKQDRPQYAQLTMLHCEHVAEMQDRFSASIAFIRIQGDNPEEPAKLQLCIKLYACTKSGFPKASGFALIPVYYCPTCGAEIGLFDE